MDSLARINRRHWAIITLSTAMLAGCGGGQDSQTTSNDNNNGGGVPTSTAAASTPASSPSTSTTGTSSSSSSPGTDANTGTGTSSTTATSTDWPPPPQQSPATACATAMTGSHATYNVGPGKTYTELTNVPWLSLQAGDVVNIHYRAEPYRTKIGLRAQGTAQAPVVINGVTSDTCQRPVLNAENAVTATDSRTAGFGRDIQGAGLIQIYRSPTDPYDTFTPRYITIQNLMLTGAKGGKNFKDNAGANASYGTFSAAIYAVRVHNLTVENCAITGNGLGVFTNTKGDTQDSYSADIIIRRNRIYDNGYTTDDHEHNLYIQARRALYEGNYIGQAFAGSSIKDRSSGTVIRYNMILASARAIDLVETEEEYFSNVEPDPLYNYAWVYGNIIVNDSQLPGGSFSGNIVHWGFDNNPAKSHAGTLFFYQNTLINRVPQSSFWYTNIFQLGKDGTVPTGIKAEISSNVFWQQGGNEWRFLTDKGTLQFMGTNYVPTNWSASVPGQSADVRTQGSTLITGLDPNLDASFTPLSGAPVLGKAIVAPSTTPTGATAANLQVAHQYKEGVGIVALPARLTGSSGAIGALQRP